jgi:hypothetical protein
VKMPWRSSASRWNSGTRWRFSTGGMVRRLPA